MRAAVALLFLMLVPAMVHAEKRVALVIGNSAYVHAGTLANPKNDATDVAAALKKSGFEVIAAFDLNKTAFERRVRDLERHSPAPRLVFSSTRDMGCKL